MIFLDKIMNSQSSITAFLNNEIIKNELLCQAVLKRYETVGSYIEKLNKTAEVCIYEHDEKVKGLIYYYCNNPEQINAFITLLIVAGSEQKKGVATNLLTEAINSMKQRGFKNCLLEVDVDNDRAIMFYQKNGFDIINEDNRNYTMQRIIKS